MTIITTIGINVKRLIYSIQWQITRGLLLHIAKKFEKRWNFPLRTHRCNRKSFFGGWNSRDPAGRSGCSAKEIFGGFRISWRLRRQVVGKGTYLHPEKIFGFVGLVCTLLNVLFAFGECVIPLTSFASLPPSISLRTLREVSTADFVRDPVRFSVSSQCVCGTKTLWRQGTAAIRTHQRLSAGRWTRRRQAAAFPDASDALNLWAALASTHHSSRELKPTAADIEPPLTRF